MAKRDDLTADFVRQILDYNQKTGKFTWRRRPREHFKTTPSWGRWNTRYSGAAAGYLGQLGYLRISIDAEQYGAHRLAWLYMTGAWPANSIDHINMDRADNSWPNLREATASQNRANTGAPCNNTSGVKGVDWYKRTGQWRVHIWVNGKSIHIGHFDSIDAASAAYKEAAIKYFKEFARI